MQFLPAGELIGEAHQIRTVTLSDSLQSPTADYTFIDGYCTDPKCDCRKTIIRIIKDSQHVSTVNYGWEKPNFYAKWAGLDDEVSREMSGLSIDFMSPDLISQETTLDVMKAVLDEQWISQIKATYQAVRAELKKANRVNNLIRLQPKISRNTPRPCGSGLKSKRCCG